MDPPPARPHSASKFPSSGGGAAGGLSNLVHHYGLDVDGDGGGGLSGAPGIAPWPMPNYRPRDSSSSILVNRGTAGAQSSFFPLSTDTLAPDDYLASPRVQSQDFGPSRSVVAALGRAAAFKQQTPQQKLGGPSS